MNERKAIPIGIEDFKVLIDRQCYLVDKTLMIKELIDSSAMVTLFTRPRRFGKTLNMSMLKRYFEKTDDDNSYLFDGLKISEAGEKYRQYMGQYPVISISLKGMKQPTFELSLIEFKKIIYLILTEKIFWISAIDAGSIRNIIQRLNFYQTACMKHMRKK